MLKNKFFIRTKNNFCTKEELQTAILNAILMTADNFKRILEMDMPYYAIIQKLKNEYNIITESQYFEVVDYDKN